MSKELKLSIRHFIDSRTKNQEQRVCIIVYIIGVVMAITGMPLHLLGVLGINNPVLQTISVASWTVSVIVFGLYLKRIISLITAVSIFTITLQVAQTARIVYNTIVQPEGFVWAIVLNQIISLIIIIHLVIGFVRWIPIANTVISLATLLFAYYCTDGALNRQVVVIFTFVEVFTCLIGDFIQRSIHNMQRENTNYKVTEQGILDAFDMTKEELNAYVKLCRQNKPTEKSVSGFFEHLDDLSEANLIRAVNLRIGERHMKRQDMAELLPQLTPTELEVCRLIMGGKTLAEIAQIMGKKPNNIGTVRIHIRRKLKLTKGADLKEALIKISEKGKGKREKGKIKREK